MEEEEILKVLKKIEIVDSWYSEMTGAEYNASNTRIMELLIKLEEVK